MSLSYPIRVDYVFSICLATSMVWICLDLYGANQEACGTFCTCIAFGPNSASSSVSLTDLVAQRCGTRALLHQVSHETSLLQSLQNESE